MFYVEGSGRREKREGNGGMNLIEVHCSVYKNAISKPLNKERVGRRKEREIEGLI
jgi:hypothetical protein